MAGGAVLLTADVRSGGSVSVAIGGATSAPVTSSGTDVVLHFDKPLPKLGAKVVVDSVEARGLSLSPPGVTQQVRMWEC